MNFSRIALTLVLVSTTALAAEPTPDDFFERQVRPLLVEKCQSCHTEKKQRGGLALTSRSAMLKGGDSGPALVSGDPDKSLLIQAIRYHDALRMPPKEKLPDRDVEILTRWVKLGAPWPDDVPQAGVGGKPFTITAEQRQFWSFQPVRSVEPASTRIADWLRNPLDRFILAQLESRNLRPAPPADRQTLIRRVTFDLLGLPPTIEEVEAFVHDARPDAYERLVDRLLASPAHGERWARHWLDVVRYTDSFDSRGLGGEGDCSEAWRYRDWVVRALNADLPYDHFVRRQIAGDVEPGDRDGILATGMLAIGNWGGGDADKEKLLTDIVDDQIDVVGKAFLGLTISCARCHDHKFDPISTADYYALAGIFFSSHVLPNVGPKTGGPPMLRIPLATPEELKQRKLHAERQKQLEQDRETLHREARLVLTRRQAARAADYLTALTASSSRTSPAEIAKANDLSEAVLIRLRQYLQAEPYRPFDRRFRNVMDRAGVHAWRGEADCPNLLVNTTDQAHKLLTFTLPPRSASVHPGPKSGVVVAWRSPTSDVVRLSGKLTDVDPACGDGVIWTLQLRRGTEVHKLASGSVPNGGSQSLDDTAPPKALEAVSVEPNDSLELIVSPGAGYECDTTTISLTITGNKKSWNLADDLLANLDEVGKGGWSFHDTDGGRILATPAMREQWQRLVQSGGTDRELLDQLARQLPDDLDGPFAPGTIDPKELPVEWRNKLRALTDELDAIGKSLARPLEYANGVREGGVPDSPHAGIHDVRIHVRGRYDRLGELVPRRFPELFSLEPRQPKFSGSGRRELAHWLTRDDHPLTARVIVNRIWQHHFGRGIVNTPSNFGLLGDRPTHPELLDWLATELIRSGWSLKHLHRLIVTSSTYQQHSLGDEQTHHDDPENLLLGRMTRRRLEAEAVRDNLLHVAGRLDRQLEGRATLDFSSPRRTLYQMTVRSDRSGFAPLFDVADSTQPVEKRTVSTVAPQALFLLNNAFVRSQATALIQRVSAERDHESDKIDLLHRLLYARSPSREEVELGLAFLGKGRSWDDYALILLCANEFIYLD